MSIRTHNPPLTPTTATVDSARLALADLDRPGSRFALVDQDTGAELPLGDQFMTLLRQMFTSLAQGRPIAILPLDHELTPNQAAEILNVSRSYVLRQIADGALPARMVGTHHRIRIEDLMSFKQKSDAEYERGMDDLVALEQNMGLD